MKLKKIKQKIILYRFPEFLFGKVKKKLEHLELTDMEKTEGGEVLWMTPEKALKKMKNNYHMLNSSQYSTLYSTKISAKRDIILLEEYLKRLAK